ncbi:daunorubicin resistance protein DrrA family ABC transporter ATP-binding protein [Jongsikchunia kroppenstedtii]|uniref:daunorubicin resistance protein DrrA family ABC transporter ATP-binding protein n=1 Tax=Jongsikchunia kroppenstedtii TaxID=1121721 RepID=UPI0004773A8E|nr:daunorubicin resistance protein DrrA family ABC transporter ATP-binding protein [Jongsikchunia kroppenstedtii]
MNQKPTIVTGIGKIYGRGARAVHALTSVDLDIPPGSIHGVLGPNGAGKSTAVRIIATLLKPTTGTVSVAGVDALKHPRDARSLIGLSGQYAAVDENLTGRENLRMVARLYGFRGRSIAARSQELIDQFRLNEFADRRSGTYSGGMRRRLDLAAALIARPPLVILDEPTTGLDPRSRQEMWDVIKTLGDDGAAVLLTTQYLDEADELAHTLSVIDHGRVIAEGTPGELKESVAATSVRIQIAASDRTEDAAELLRPLANSGSVDVDGDTVTFAASGGTESMVEGITTLVSAGIGVRDARAQEPSLDDVFFAVTGKAPVADDEPAEPVQTTKAATETTEPVSADTEPASDTTTSAVTR